MNKNKNGSSKKSPSPNKSKIGAGSKSAQKAGNSLNQGNNNSQTALIQESQQEMVNINKKNEQALIDKKKKSSSQAEASDANKTETENTQRQDLDSKLIRKIYWVKKNLIDPTASLSYSIGVSIVHLAMAFTLIFVDRADMLRYTDGDQAKLDDLIAKVDPDKPTTFSACMSEVADLDTMMLMFVVTHIICFIACFYREVYSAKTDLFGQFMRIIEVFCIPIYMAAILMSLEQLSLILIREHTSNPDDRVSGTADGRPLYRSEKNKIPDLLFQKCPKADYRKIAGTTTEWIIVEVLVFGYFIVTMLLLLIKSRYRKIGIDNSGQFEPLYMKYLVDNITKSVLADIAAKSEINKNDNPEDFYIDKERMVTVEGVSLKVCFTEEDFQTLVQGHEIDKKDTTNWIKRNVVGKISKQELDTERMVETNSLDMMQNSGIIYHTESILEMQVASLVTVFFLNRRWQENFGYMNLKKEDGVTLQSSSDSLGLGLTYVAHSELIIYILLGEHIMSYFFGMFRSWELKNKGEPNSYGIETAPCEKVLRFIEILVDLVIFVFVIFHLSDMTPEQRNNIPFLHLWIIIDNIIMFFTLPYTILTQVVMVAGEITKNVFTLYQVQRRKLRKRRNEIKDQAALKKNFFTEDNATTTATDTEKKKAQKPVMKIKGQEVDQPAKPKKKKKLALSYADEINNENRQNENEDVTSDSSEESSSDTDDDKKLKDQAKLEVVIKEEDFAENEQLVFSNDVYNYTICANMTKCCSPLQQGFALKQCFIVFAVQFLVPLFFLTEFGFDDFTQPELTSTAVRLICGQLLHMIIYGEIKQALSVLRYLKYVKTAKGGKRGRLINIILCFLQMVSPYFTEATLVIAISQTPSSSMIIKSFVALGFVIKIDDMFSENFPKEIKATAEDTVLIIGKDQNTYSKIFKRMKKDYQFNKNGIQWTRAFQNVVINILYLILNNVYIIFYYYFLPICIPFFQFFMFYVQNVEVRTK